MFMKLMTSILFGLTLCTGPGQSDKFDPGYWTSNPSNVPYQLQVKINLPKGNKLNPMAKSSLTFTPGTYNSPRAIEVKSKDFKTEFFGPPGSFSIRGDAKIFYCEDKPGGMCFVKDKSFSKVVKDSSSTVILTLDILKS